MTESKWMKIIDADNDTVGDEAITWAGVSELWNENSEITYNLIPARIDLFNQAGL